jgi:diaminopimelate decarboxylase
MREPAGRGPWPEHASFGEDGLVLGGVTASSLAERHGTPLLVVDELDLRERARRVRAAFADPLYAVKAFTSSAVVRIVLEEGLGLLAATGGEVEACLRAGAPASRIVMHGNAKTDEELELAVGAGLRLVVADGLDELQRLDAVAREQRRVQPVLLRVVPDVEVETHEAIATGHDASKFGTSLPAAADVIAAAGAMGGLRVEGVHAHVGSQVLDIEPYLRTVDALLDPVAEVRTRAGVELSTIDVGGGFGVCYVAERPLTPEELGPALADRIDEGARRRGIWAPAVIVEPGRWIVANPGLTLYRVIARKSVGSADGEPRRLLAVDGGMSDNIRPALYDARYVVARASASTGDSGHGGVPFTIVGRHCESGDTLAEVVVLPEATGPGDLLAFAATGAYTYSLASTYNRVGRPAVAAVREGTSSPWLRREDAGDLDRLELGVVREQAGAPPEGITIRPARPGDARSYLEFWTAIVEEGRHVRTERVTGTVRGYRRRFRHPWTDREAQIVAVDGDDRVVGHVYVQRESHPVTRHVATLGIAVEAGARGRGIGSALLAEAVRWARSVGVDKVALSVYPHNTGAIALYRKFGFIEEGRLARHSRKSYGDEDEILMAAWIDRTAEAGDAR